MLQPVLSNYEYEAEIRRLSWEIDLLRAELEHSKEETDWLRRALTNVIRDSHTEK